jgi:hypothetical protein
MVPEKMKPFLTAALFCVLIALTIYPASPNDQVQDNGGCRSCNISVSDVSSVLIAIVTSIYAFFAYRQWQAIAASVNEARASLVHNREALRLEQRPWVVATGGGKLDYAIREMIGEGTPTEMLDDARVKGEVPFQINLKNSGKTPALDLTIRLEWQSSKGTDEMPERPKYSGERSDKFTIGAIGPDIVHEHRGTFRDFPREVRQAIKMASRFTICGLIEYRGPMPSPSYTTKFCLLWQGREGPFVVSGPYNDCS